MNNKYTIDLFDMKTLIRAHRKQWKRYEKCSKALKRYGSVKAALRMNLRASKMQRKVIKLSKMLINN